MARIAIAQWRKGRIIADIGKARIVRRIVQTTRQISGHRTDFGNGEEEALDVIRNVAPQPALLERWRSSGRKVFADGLVAKKISSIGDSSGLPIQLIDQTNDAHDKGPRMAGPAAVDRSRRSRRF